MNPLNGVAMLFRRSEDRKHKFLGSCFSLRHSTHFLTAAHCISNRETAEVIVVSPTDYKVRDVLEMHRHPNADIAVLIIRQEQDNKIESFWDSVGNLTLGKDFVAYGFPEDALGPNEGKPTARLFKGYYQRFMDHNSHMGYSYIAGELNIQCPGGLSGGPLFNPGAPVMLSGLATESLEASTLFDSQEVILNSGQVVSEHYRTVVNYGVALVLESVKEWINQYVPPRNGT